MRFAGRIRGERPIFHRLVKVCYVAGWLNAAMRLIRSCFHLPRRVRLVLTFAMVQVFTLAVYINKPSKSVDVQLVDADGSGVSESASSGDRPWNQTLTLTDDTRRHFDDVATSVGVASNCYVEGTDLEATAAAKDTECHCRTDYHGVECGIPSAIWFGLGPVKRQLYTLRPRKRPRRIIHGLNINHEVDFFEIRLEELQDAVDAYIVCESNYTAAGTAKPLHLLERLKSGFMEPFHRRLVHVSLLHFPPAGRTDGWFVDHYLRTYMGVRGLQRIRGLRPDDLFVLLDADEIPTREVLMFLKLYDGYPEPVVLGLRWSIFGFFWKRRKIEAEASFLDLFVKSVKLEKKYEEEMLKVSAVSTMAMVWQVCRNDTFLIRKDMSRSDAFQQRQDDYSRTAAQPVHAWTAGKAGRAYGGFHCSWCYTAEGIRTKLLSAHVDDKPRWGDYANKTDLKFIRRLIATGRWFDGSAPFVAADWEKEEQYAPRYVLQHSQRFADLLYPPSVLNQSLNSIH